MTEVILCLSGFCHVSIFVLCNIATVHVVKIIHLSATELARCRIFRKDSRLLNEYDYFVCYHVTLIVIVLCNITTVSVVKTMVMLSTLSIP